MSCEIIIDADGEYYDPGTSWFGEVVTEDGTRLHLTGPRPTPEDAEYSARQWLAALVGA